MSKQSQYTEISWGSPVSQVPVPRDIRHCIPGVGEGREVTAVTSTSSANDPLDEPFFSQLPMEGI